MPAGAPPCCALSVVVVTWNSAALIGPCLDHARAALAGFDHELIVVDNGSADDTVARLRRAAPAARLIANPGNEGFARACNQALAVAGGRFVLLLNPDAELTAAALAGLAAWLETHPDAGAVGPQLVDADGALQNSVAPVPDFATELGNKALLGWLFPARYPSQRPPGTGPVEVASLIGACLMVRRTAVDSVGGLDERFFFFLEETDWCLRLRRAGWRVVFLPALRVRHWQGQSKAHAPVRAWIEYYRSMYRFFAKHYGPVSLLALVPCRVLKLAVNFFSTGALVLATAGLAARPRRRFCCYGGLLAWHLCGCPAGWGLRAARPARPSGAVVAPSAPSESSRAIP